MYVQQYKRMKNELMQEWNIYEEYLHGRIRVVCSWDSSTRVPEHPKPSSTWIINQETSIIFSNKWSYNLKCLTHGCEWYPSLLFCSEAARRATQTFLILLAPMLELLPISWFRWTPTLLYSHCSLSILYFTLVLASEPRTSKYSRKVFYHDHYIIDVNISSIVYKN